jgi:hypothetical protein
VASQLLYELHWTESQLGAVQASFFAGYALTQVLGGLLGGGGSRHRRPGENSNIRRTSTSDSYRTVMPLSLFLTAIATLLFPIAAKLGGSEYASLDRFCLGLFEGLLLPAAMAGVSDTTTTTNATTVDKATASSIVIAGCYFGSAWAYFSASVLFSEQSQIQLLHWVNAIDTTTTSSNVSVWSWAFYLNGLISLVCLILFRDEFDFIISPLSSFSDDKKSSGDTENDNIDDVYLWKETQLIVKSTLSSKSGRAIILAQIGQGALLYSIASWGPLYLERIATSSTTLIDTTSIESNIIFGEIAFTPSSPPSLPSSSVSPTLSSSAVSASIAASSLILPQITQALVGVGIGLSADKLSSKIGTRTTRRSLQIVSGVVPAILLWYLSYRGSNSNGNASGNEDGLLSPVFVFAAAQTISALSLGAVSVSHLDIAVPSSAGAVYALGNVAAAASGSLVVNLFGRLLDEESVEDDEFALPLRIIATLSAVGSLIYGCTVESEIEIGLNRTAV